MRRCIRQDRCAPADRGRALEAVCAGRGGSRQARPTERAPPAGRAPAAEGPTSMAGLRRLSALGEGVSTGSTNGEGAQRAGRHQPTARPAWPASGDCQRWAIGVSTGSTNGEGPTSRRRHQRGRPAETASAGRSGSRQARPTKRPAGRPMGAGSLRLGRVGKSGEPSGWWNCQHLRRSHAGRQRAERRRPSRLG